MEENDDEDMEVIYREFTEQKADLENYENVLNLDWWIHKEKSRKALLRLTLLRIYKTKLIRNFSEKIV